MADVRENFIMKTAGILNLLFLVIHVMYTGFII